MRARIAFLVVAALLATFTSPDLRAQPLVNIETVRVGDAGNAADTRVMQPGDGTTGYGAVTNVFRMGKYEVTIGQYSAFLNSVARTNTNSYIVSLWTANMADTLNIAGISRSGNGVVGDPFTYSVIGPSGITPAGASSPGNRPIAYVSWFDAARFANWINNGATNGAGTETGAYTLNGATNGIIIKNAGATWWIPTEDEWYKAAYYKGGGNDAGYWLYPTKSDTEPGNTIGGANNQANHRAIRLDGPPGYFAVTQSIDWPDAQNYLTDVGGFNNSASPYGTYDQGGNLGEWNDAVISSSRGARGGAWCFPAYFQQSSRRFGVDPSGEYFDVGFRVAAVAPPPTTNVVLTVEKTTSLSGQWQFDREINVGPMTNANEFYRLKIRTVVE